MESTVHHPQGDVQQTFLEACRSGDLSHVKDVVSAAACKLEATDRLGNTPLLLAIHGGHSHVAKELLDAGANPDAPSRTGESPLHLAAHAGNVTMLTLLVAEHDADVDATDNVGRTPLHTAAHHGQKGAVNLLISAGAIIDCRTTDMYTPMHFACWNGHADVAAALHEAGGDVNAVAKSGATPLQKAVEKHHVALVRWLIFKGANVTTHGPTPVDAHPLLDALPTADRLRVLDGDDRYPLDVLVNHKASLWVQIVQLAVRRGDLTRVRSYLARHPQLAYARDISGREVMSMLGTDVAQAVRAGLHWHGRYRVTDSTPLYSSTRAVALSAVDAEDIDDYGQARPVVLKLTLNKDQYRREIDARASNLSEEYVVKVLGNHPRYAPQKMRCRLPPPTLGRRESGSRRISLVHAAFPLSRKSSLVREVSVRPGGGFNVAPWGPTLTSPTATATAADLATALTAACAPLAHVGDTPELHAAPEDVAVDLSAAATNAINATGAEDPTSNSSGSGGFHLGKDDAERMYCVVLPRADRTLHTALKFDDGFAGGGPVVRPAARAAFAQLARAVAHVHDAGIIHGDITPMNCVQAGGRWKLTDLDSAVAIGELPAGRYASSTAYVPPECFFVDSDGCLRMGFGELSHLHAHVAAHPSFDVWGLGCVLYQMLTADARPLFRGDQRDQLPLTRPPAPADGAMAAGAAAGAGRDSAWDVYTWTDAHQAAKLAHVGDPQGRALLADMLHPVPARRPTAAEILAHPFVTTDAAGIDPGLLASAGGGGRADDADALARAAAVRAAAPSPSYPRAEAAAAGRPRRTVDTGAPGPADDGDGDGDGGDEGRDTLSAPDAAAAAVGGKALALRSPSKGTTSRIDVHRVLYDLKDLENRTLRAELGQSREMHRDQCGVLEGELRALRAEVAALRGTSCAAAAASVRSSVAME